MLPCGCETTEHLRPPVNHRRGPALLVTRRCLAHQAERRVSVNAFRSGLMVLRAAERECPACGGEPPCSEHEEARHVLLETT